MFRLLIVVSYPLMIISQIGYFTENVCLDQNLAPNPLILSCPRNQLIKLGRIIYGYSWSNDCSYIDKDCTMNVPREDISCQSIHNCSVRVVEHPLILQDCWNLAATYVQAEYECIKDYTIKDICQKQDLISSQGFLSTPTYPFGFSSQLNCPCLLTPSINHSIIFELIDISLFNCSEANLLLWIGQDFQYKCSKQNPVTLISNIQQNISMRFVSLKQSSKGGILIKYSVSPQSNNGSIRLQCLGGNNRSMAINQFLYTKNPNENEDEEDISMLNTKQFRALALENDNPMIVKQDFNQTNPKKNFLLESPRSNIIFMILFIITISIFLLIINILVCFLCSLRPKSSRSTSSSSNKDLFHPTFPRSANRLKTLHSLLYAHPKRSDMEPITSDPSRRIDSILSDIQSSSPTTANVNHGFIFKSKSNSNIHEPRQINSWDDI